MLLGRSCYRCLGDLLEPLVGACLVLCISRRSPNCWRVAVRWRALTWATPAFRTTEPRLDMARWEGLEGSRIVLVESEGIPFRHIVRCTAIWKDCLLSKHYLNRSTFCPKFIFSWTPQKKTVPGIFNGTYTWLLATPFCIYYVSSSWNSPIQNVHNIIVYCARKPGNIPQRSVMTIFIACMVPRWPVEYPQNPLVKFEQIVFSDVLGTVWFLLARRKLVF